MDAILTFNIQMAATFLSAPFLLTEPLSTH